MSLGFHGKEADQLVLCWKKDDDIIAAVSDFGRTVSRPDCQRQEDFHSRTKRKSAVQLILSGHQIFSYQSQNQDSDEHE